MSSQERQPTRVAMTLGSTSRNGGEFEFRKISLSLDRDLGALENPLDAFRDVKALLEKMLTEFQGPAYRGKQESNPAGNGNQPVPPRPAASKPHEVPQRGTFATLQERLGARLQDVEVVEGFDGLSVKPKKYLGESWSEINEVVRALGGKWQKGQMPKDGSWRIPK